MTSNVVDLVTRALAALPEAALRTGDFDGVEALLSEALRQAQADGDLRSQADALDQMGLLRHFRTLKLAHRLLFSHGHIALDPDQAESWKRYLESDN